ncbi:MAG: pilus assembly protein TadG-related protein [Candidatus Dormiibacterota bacterium]
MARRFIMWSQLRGNFRRWRPVRDRRSRLRGQGGQVAVLFALSAVVLVAVVGLAVDGGSSYVSQRAFQGGVDSASDAGARMLAADFTACISSTTLPYTNSQIATATASVVTAAVTGSSANTTGSPLTTAQYVTDTTGTPSPVSGTISSYSGTLCTSGVWTGPQGVQVQSTASHKTFLLNVVGISTATESAHAISLFGPVGSGPDIPFVAYADLSCGTTNTPVVPGSVITYYDSPNWANDYPNCPIPGPSSFKGFLKDQTPTTLTVPGSFTAQDGGAVGQWPFPISAGQTLLLPLVLCQATAQFPNASCSYSSPLYTLYAVGLIEIKAIGNCRSSADAPCQGTVLPVVSGGLGGIIFCPTSGSPSCSSTEFTNPDEPIAVELWQ